MYGKRNAGKGTKFSYEFLKHFVSSQIMKSLKYKCYAARKAKYSHFREKEFVPGNRSKMISWVLELQVVYIGVVVGLVKLLWSFLLMRLEQELSSW